MKATAKILESAVVYATTEYDKFKFLGGNRKLNKANVRKLKQSMEEEQLIIPIIVNEKMEIIDGQHRYEVCQILKKPVYFIVNKGYGIAQVKRANTVGVNWTSEDFLLTYMNDGNESYISINEVKKEFGLSINIVLKILAAFKETGLPVVTDRFKNGEISVSEDELSGVRYFCSQLTMFSAYKEYKSSSFVTAFLKLYFHDDYDFTVMEKQAKWMGNFQPKGRSSEIILEELCKNVYSYRLTTGKKIFYYRELQRFTTLN